MDDIPKCLTIDPETQEATCSSPSQRIYDGPYFMHVDHLQDGDPWTPYQREYYVVRCGKCYIPLERIAPSFGDERSYYGLVWRESQQTFLRIVDGSSRTSNRRGRNKAT